MSKSFASFVRDLRNGAASLLGWGCLSGWRNTIVAKSAASACASARPMASHVHGNPGTPSTVPLPTYGDPYPLTDAKDIAERVRAMASWVPLAMTVSCYVTDNRVWVFPRDPKVGG